ncbi:MAG: universal stress protein [Phycisphaeraceae bacterium]
MSNWLPKKTVLIPVDFSPPAMDAIKVARDLVGDESGLHVLYVMPENMPVPVEGAWVPPPTEQELETSRSALTQKLADLGLKGVVVAVRPGSAASTICEYAQEIGAELIVIPSHGRTGLKHLLIGSVAERVARHSPCPVLILRRKD